MLKQSFTYQLASISDDAIKPAAKLFEHRFGLDVQALRVLRLVGDQPGVNFTTLAAQTRLERSATSRILSRLIKSGLIRRELDEDDARQFRLFITEPGLALRRQADPLSLALEELILQALPEGERQQFRQSLDKLSDWLAREFQGELARRFPEIRPGRRRRAEQGAQC